MENTLYLRRLDYCRCVRKDRRRGGHCFRMRASQNSPNGQERRVVSRRDKTQWPAAKCNSLEADCTSSSVRTRAHVHLPESEGCPGCFAETAERPMAASQTLSDPSSLTSDRLRSQLETLLSVRRGSTHVFNIFRSKRAEPIAYPPGLQVTVHVEDHTSCASRVMIRDSKFSDFE